MKIGKFTIQHFETGDFALDGGAMFGVVPKPLWSKAYNSGDELNRIPMTARGLLIQYEDRRIIVDTGCGSKMPLKLQNIYHVDYTRASIQASLEIHNLKAQDITDVIFTHLHFDHAGGSTYRTETGEIVPMFPNAKHYVQKDHLSWARNPTDKDKASFMPENWEPIIHNGMMEILDGPGELFPGLSVQTLHGHTQALQMITVNDDIQTLIFPADLLPTAAHIPVPYVMGYDNFPLTSMEEKHKILTKAVEEKWIICFEHDAFVPAGNIKHTDKGFALAEKVEL